MPESHSIDLAGETSDRQEQAGDLGGHTGSTHNLSSQVQELRLEIEQLRATVSNAATRPPIEFPKFNGENYSTWIYRCRQLFEVYKETPDDVRVRLASIHMEGDALRWHERFMKRRDNTPISWEDYVKEIENKFRDLRTAISSDATKSTPSVGRKRRGPWICKQLRDDDDDDIQELKPHHFRFGPVYCRGELEEYAKHKQRAWDIVVKKSPGGEADITEHYMSQIRLIEEESRACYADRVDDSLSGTQFRWMMIKDGCFFLQLTFHILGESRELGYSYDNPVFGRGRSTSKFKDVKEWIEAMFHVGNQIPFVVLKMLLKQDYFQAVIKARKWNNDDWEVSRTALYELLLFPELEVQGLGLWRKILNSRDHWLLKELKPRDLLHGFQLLVIGPRQEEDLHDDDDEEEAYYESIIYAGNVDDIESRPASELFQTGIHFRDSSHAINRSMSFINSIFCHWPRLTIGSRGLDIIKKSIFCCHWPTSRFGSRGIHFMNSAFCCHGYPILHLPPILLREDTKMMFQCLKNYEMSQKSSSGGMEFCSYMRFMGELIRTPDDARIMEGEGIIQGNVKQKHKVPPMLQQLAPKKTYNQNLRRVKLKVGDYSAPIWKKYWQVLSLGFAVAVLQTVYTVLPYYTKN